MPGLGTVLTFSATTTPEADTKSKSMSKQKKKTINNLLTEFLPTGRVDALPLHSGHPVCDFGAHYAQKAVSRRTLHAVAVERACVTV